MRFVWLTLCNRVRSTRRFPCFASENDVFGGGGEIRTHDSIYGRGGGVGRGLGVNAGLAVGEGLGVKVGVGVDGW